MHFASSLDGLCQVTTPSESVTVVAQNLDTAPLGKVGIGSGYVVDPVLVTRTPIKVVMRYNAGAVGSRGLNPATLALYAALPPLHDAPHKIVFLFESRGDVGRIVRFGINHVCESSVVVPGMRPSHVRAKHGNCDGQLHDRVNPSWITVADHRSASVKKQVYQSSRFVHASRFHFNRHAATPLFRMAE